MGHHEEKQECAFTDAERVILILFALMPPPITLDMIVDFTKQSPISVLNTLEGLIKRKWICPYPKRGDFGFEQKYSGKTW
ncbi:hypothetical protein DSCA_50530 [Desulfosarcina alkanivorans]|uniref:HTH marR-type domain-containing protein n=1 Tax=Desulfosarcina alkanivorans TaxID=571177 RepID=A0A5K7YSK0_9BACT|nr:hypothetical protein [Desulfosarcina alkanivorans]BBO71123.1 hypothetical protein DSCA_50530 [Desulfosarcina alkanivorans]